MNNLAQRVITAVIAIPVVFFLLWFCDYTRIGLMVLLGGVGAWEWAKMATKKYGGPDVRFVALLSSVLFNRHTDNVKYNTDQHNEKQNQKCYSDGAVFHKNVRQKGNRTGHKNCHKKNRDDPTDRLISLLL